MNRELATPRIGLLSSLAALTVFVLQVVFGLWVLFYYGSWIGQAIWIGLMWLGCALTASTCFTALVSWRRVLLGTAGALWHVLFMSICWRESPLRYVLLLGALMVLQVAASTALGIPAWQSWRSEHDIWDPKYRFTIRSILVITTIIAVLLATARTYEISAIATPLLAVPLLVMLFHGAASAMLAQQHRRLRAVSLVVVLLGGSLLYSWMAFALESVVSDQISLRDFTKSLTLYQPGLFIWQMQVTTFSVFTVGALLWFGFGRIDQRDFQLRKQRRIQQSDLNAAKLSQEV